MASPKPTDSETILTIHKLYDKLVHRIEPDYGLLDALYPVVKLEEHSCITVQTTVYERNKKLLNLLLNRKLPEYCNEFLDGLQKSEQLHVFHYIVHTGVHHADVGTCWPLNDKQLYNLRASLKILVNHLDTVSLVIQLFAVECINLQQKTAINTILDPSARIRKLVDILTRRSAANYKQFLDILENEQSFVLELLQKAGFAMLIDVHADLDPTTVDSVPEAEQAIVGGFARLLLTWTTVRVDDVIERLQSLSLVATMITGSIGSFFVCKTLKSLLHLHRLFEDGTLKNLLEKLFAALTNNQNIRIERLRWNKEDYEESVLYFISGYSRASDQESIYRMHVSENLNAQTLTELPADVLSMVVVRSIHLLSRSLDDHSAAWNSLGSVCHDFYRTLRHSVIERRARMAEEKLREEEVERRVEEELRQLAEKKRKLQEELKRIEESKAELKRKLDSESQLSFMAGEGPSLGASPLEPQSKPRGEEEGDDSGSEDH